MFLESVNSRLDISAPQQLQSHDWNRGTKSRVDGPEFVQKVRIIQRQYRRFALNKLITQLKCDQEWLFSWDEPRLGFYELQDQMQNPEVVARVRRMLEFLGSSSTASSCHSKMLLMAVMLNHYGDELGVHDAVMLERVHALGAAFQRVCAGPRCWINRIMFMIAYSQYTTKFLDWKANDAQRLVEQELACLQRNFENISHLKKLLRQGKIGVSRGKSLIQMYRTKSHHNFVQASRLLGGVSKKARHMAQRWLIRSVFLKDLAHTMRASNYKLEYTRWEEDNNTGSEDGPAPTPALTPTPRPPSSSSEKCRMACAHYILQGHIDPPQFGSRDYCGPMGEKLFTKWYGSDFMEWKVIKMSIGQCDGMLNETQKDWLVPLLGYSCHVISKIRGLKSHRGHAESCETPILDHEFICQQIGLNNCDAAQCLIHLISLLKQFACDHTELDYVTDMLAHEGITRRGLDVYVDIMACACAKVTSVELSLLVDRAKSVRPLAENELLQVVDGLVKDPKQFELICDTVYAARKSHQDTSWDRLVVLGLNFVDTLCGKMCQNQDLCSLPPTLSQFSLDILRVKLDIRQVVTTFCIMYYLIGVSQCDASVCKMKQQIKNALSLPTTATRLERLFTVADETRPQMDNSERNLVRGLIKRLVENGESGPVGELALSRIRSMLAYAVCPDAAPSKVQIQHFECEVNEIVSKAINIWQCSLSTYQPVYACISRARWMWETSFNMFE